METILDMDRVMTAGAVLIVGLGASGYLAYRGLRKLMRSIRKEKT